MLILTPVRRMREVASWSQNPMPAWPLLAATPTTHLAPVAMARGRARTKTRIRSLANHRLLGDITMRHPTPTKGSRTSHLRRLEEKAGAETTSSRQGKAATAAISLLQGGAETAADPHRLRLEGKAGVREATMSLGIAGQRRTRLVVTEPTDSSVQKTHVIV